MREGMGLYKAKRIDNGEWVEGYFFAKPILEKYFIIKGENQWMVDPETVCQWTGLVDKNGMRVFEGDIVRHYNKIDVGQPYDYDTGEIRWNKNNCRFERTSSESITGYETVFIGSDCVYEVIGSIHDKAVEE